MKSITTRREGLKLRCIQTDQQHHRYVIYEGKLPVGWRSPIQRKELIRTVLFVLNGTALAQIDDSDYVELQPFSVLNIQPGSTFTLQQQGLLDFDFLCFYAPQINEETIDFRWPIKNHLSVVKDQNKTNSARNGVKVSIKEMDSNGYMVSCIFKAGYRSQAVRYIGFEEIWFVLKGEAIIWLNDGIDVKKTSLRKHQSLHIHNGNEIQFQNDGEDILEVLVMQVPVAEQMDTKVIARDLIDG